MDKKPEKLVPEVRFKGFTDDWEQHKLGEVAKVTMGQSPSSKNYTDNPNDYVLVQGNADLKSNEISPRVWTKEVTKQVHKGEFIMTVRAPVGYLATANMDAVIGRGVAAIDGNKYLYYLLQTKLLDRTWEKLSSGSTFESISSNDIKNLEIKVTETEEEKLIAKLMDTVTYFVTLQQRKLKQLKQLKKAMLQQLFVDKNNKQPNLRFKNFNGDWEQRKFKTLLISKEGIRRGPFGSMLKKDSFVPRSKNSFAVYEQRNAIYNKFDVRYFIDSTKYAKLKNFHLHENDIIMSGAGTIGRLAKIPHNFKKGVFNQALIRFRVNDEVNTDYFLSFMITPAMQKKLTEANPGSAMVNLVPMNELKNWKVHIPKLNEQTEISKLVKQVTLLLSLQQNKLTQLTTLKKYLLQKLFI